MTLVGLLGTFLATVTWVAVAFWVVSLKITPFEHRQLWRSVTEPLREHNAALPALAFAIGWFVLWMFFSTLNAYLTAAVVMLGVPALLVAEYGGDVLGITVALTGLAFNTVFGSETHPDRDRFALPFTVYDSDAEDVGRWDNAMHVPRRSLLTLGASGAGKSETLKHVVDQLQNDPSEPVIVFDMKTDYQEFLEECGASMIRLSSEGSATGIGSPIAWNVFEEMEREDDADEIARALFPEQSGEDNFFQTAARQLFAANLKYLSRELETPTNADLVDYWQRADSEKMYENLTRDGHEDLTAAASAIDPDAGRQASGVFSTAQQTVSDLFVGDFAGEGRFSVREYMQNPQGRILVLDYPTRQASTIAPVFRYLIDEAIKHGMDDSRRRAFFLLDEIEHMDVSIKRLGELINVGRGVNCQAIISLQSVAQLQDTYGKERANALLSGMTTAIILRVADSASVEFARDTIGTRFEEYTAHVERKQAPLGEGMIETNRETKLEEEHDFAKGEFRQFEPGEAIVARQGKGWVHGRIRMLEQ